MATQVIQDKPPIGAHLLAGLPASELSDALKQIRELQRLLGKKTTENEILREAVEVAAWCRNFDHPRMVEGSQAGVEILTTPNCDEFWIAIDLL